MFPKTTPVLPREANLLSSVASFAREADPQECAKILDELFFEWIGSEGSDGTESTYRARVAASYRQMKSLMDSIHANATTEVGHE